MLRHGAQTVYESRAIARYVEVTFDGPNLIPAHGRAAVLCETFVSIVCDYIYKDLVVGVLIPRFGLRHSPDNEIAASIDKCKSHFAMLDRHLGENEFLAGAAVSVADLFLVPPFFNVPKIPELHEIARRQTNLVRWAKAMGRRASIKATDPDLVAQSGQAA